MHICLHNSYWSQFLWWSFSQTVGLQLFMCMCWRIHIYVLIHRSLGWCQDSPSLSSVRLLRASSQEALLIGWRYPRNLQQCALPPISCFRFQGVDSFTFREENVLTGNFAIKTVHHIEQNQNFKSVHSHSNWGLHPVTFFNWTKLNM